MVSAQYDKSTATGKLVKEHKDNVFAIPQALAKMQWEDKQMKDVQAFYPIVEKDGANLAAAAVKEYNKGNPKPLAIHLGNCVKTFSSMLKGTPPEDFRDATRESPAVLKMLSKTFSIIDENPKLAECCRLTKEEADCARGWSRLSERSFSETALTDYLSSWSPNSMQKHLIDKSADSITTEGYATTKNRLVTMDYLAESQATIIEETNLFPSSYNPETQSFNSYSNDIWQQTQRKMDLFAVGMDNPFVTELGQKSNDTYKEFSQNKGSVSDSDFVKADITEKSIGAIKDIVVDCTGMRQQVAKEFPNAGGLANILTEALAKNKVAFKEKQNAVAVVNQSNRENTASTKSQKTREIPKTGNSKSL